MFVPDVLQVLLEENPKDSGVFLMGQAFSFRYLMSTNKQLLQKKANR